MKPTHRSALRAAASLLLVAVAAGCGDDGSSACTTNRDCTDGRICVDGRCVAPDAGDVIDDAPDVGPEDVADTPADDAPSVCTSPCVGDTHCVGGACVPWTDGEVARCDLAGGEPFAVGPRVLCHWPPAGVELDEGPEAWRWARRVTSTVVAASFEPSAGEFELPPTWLVFATGSGLNATTESAPAYAQQRGGVLRVLDPQTCTLVDTLDEVPVASWFQPAAIGDLDGDGVPEIVAQAWDDCGAPEMCYQSSGRLVAWRWDAGLRRFRVWRESTVGGAPEADLAYTAAYVVMAGPTIADLNDDGVPEVLLSGRVYDHELRRLTGQAPPGADLFMSRQPPAGPYPIQQDVVADLDDDGIAELVYGHGIWSWAGDRWAPASFFAPPADLGLAHAVLGDLGTFPESPADGAPEVVAVGYDGVRLQTIDGRVLTTLELPTGERGGSAPSLADVDGDGTPEILVGVDRGLFVYDLQCDVDTPGPECGRDTTGTGDALPRGVRWADRPPRDNWDYMGATTFDFDGDGRLEVVYADECFLRIYDGPTGEVLYSHWRPSRTASEVPVVVGTSRGADTALAIGLHTAYFCDQATGVDPTPPYDPQFPGLSCADDRDCFGPAGSCRGGRCRCTVDVDCCAPGDDCPSVGYACHEAPAGDTEGNTCRAVRVPDPSSFSASGALEEGIDVLTDAFGRWAPARSLWNQDAYHVTNVLDDGSIPSTSAMVRPWAAGAPNSFRSNVAGAVVSTAAADLTVRGVAAECSAGSPAALTAEVCNRGTRAASAGQTVRFTAGGTTLCEATTAEVARPGRCVPVRCAATPAAGTTVVAEVNPLGRTPECGDPLENVSVATAPVCP